MKFIGLSSLLIIFLQIKQTISSCSAPTPYQYNSDCYAECPWNPPDVTYLQGTTCVTTCSSGYANDYTKTCVTDCPTSPIVTFKDTTRKRCVEMCSSNPSQFGYFTNHTCLQHCIAPTYGDKSTRTCVDTCPSGSYYQISGSERICTERCYPNYYADLSNECVAATSCPLTPVQYYGDDSTNICVEECPFNESTYAESSTQKCVYFCTLGQFGDPTTRKCVSECPIGPPTYYGSNISRQCHLQCLQGEFADPSLRQCTDKCTNNTFGDYSMRQCVAVCPQSEDTYADPLTLLCITYCSPGYYADDDTRSCVLSTDCGDNFVGDPLTLQCVEPLDCPIGYYIDTVDKLCVKECSAPYWANLDTRYCMLFCQWNPPAYLSWKDFERRHCVEQCPRNPMTFSDNTTQHCVSVCPHGYFGSVVTYECVKTCPDGFHSQMVTNLCVSDCTTDDALILYYFSQNTTCIDACPEEYFADNTTLSCVETCPEQTYGYTINNTCLSGCPQTYYADDHSQLCVQYCPAITSFYADDSTNKCVQVCPVVPDYFGEQLNDGHLKCVDQCTLSSHFADPITRTCVEECNVDEGYFGYPTDRRCWLTCPSGYGNPITTQCVSICPQSPIQMYGDNLTYTCVQVCSNNTYGDKSIQMCVNASDCPSGYFGDDLTNLCVDECSTLHNLFGDPVTKKCVSVCQHGYYADNSTRTCVTDCNATVKSYKDNSTKTCVHLCPEMPDLYADDFQMKCLQLCTNDYYAVAYNNTVAQTRKCVAMCPSTPVFYADEQTRKCVTTCANLTYKFVNNTYRGCLSYCPPQVFTATHIVDLYEDNTTWTCVAVCPEGYWAFKHPTNTSSRKCVKICQKIGGVYYFAQNITRSCATECPMVLYSTYGDRINFQCVHNCSRDQYRDNDTKQCVYECSNGTFADNTTWNCVERCPWGSYGQTINKTCVQYCPTDYFAYRRQCVQQCGFWRFFADNTSWMCVEECPSQPDYYRDDLTQTCVLECTDVNKFADTFNRRCMQAINCHNQTVADPFSGKCIDRCPSHPMYFLMPDTNICGPQCFDELFADNSTNQCVQICPSPYYGVNSVTNYICVQYCPADEYMYDEDRMCVADCPDGYFADNLTMSCVTVCPDEYYGYKGNNTCMIGCDPLFSDDVSKQCVDVCPDESTASLISYHCQEQCDYGQFQHEKVCYDTCNTGLFADNLTRTCLLNCPDDPYTYADPINNKCVFMCPPTHYAYADNRTCDTQCPENLFKELTLRLCINPCLEGQIADLSNHECATDCLDSNFTFIDPSTQSCVQICPQEPDLYGYDNDTCLRQCPVGTFAQNFTRTCVQICPNVSDTVLNESWADDLTRRCVQRCSALSYSFTNQTVNLCVNECPDGYFASQALQACVQVCPNGTFAHNVSKTCVVLCPVGEYGDFHNNVCMDSCLYNNSEYKDNSTNTCVQQCPDIPSMFAQQSTSECVLFCEPGFFAYIQNRTCITDCPQPYFSDSSTGTCVLECPIHQATFADEIIRQCTSTCTNYTINGSSVIFFADPSTSRCVQVCPETPQRLYGLNQTNTCEVSCPDGTLGDNDTRLCLDECVFEDPKYTWADYVDNFCVETCPLGYYADNRTISCETQCTTGFFADNSTLRCVLICPVEPVLYGYIDNKTCIYFCPNGLFADQITRTCVSTCPTTPFVYYHYTPTNKCVRECLYPYFAEEDSLNCVELCQDGFYGNLTTHKCQLCKTECVTCSAFLQCLSCAPGFYLYEIQCVTSCPSYPIMYFAHIQSSICFLMCPVPYFGQTNTGLCQLSCPVRYYGSLITRVCTQCPTGCLTCDADGCYSCQDNYTYVADSLSCSNDCNSTHHFYFEDECHLNCPDGSYLSVIDLVTCLACVQQCATCSVIAANCTKCAYKFYYLSECVDNCPSDFYVNDDMSCIACTQNPDKCVLEPLSYTIHPFTENYKLHAYVVFNREVNMSLTQFSSLVQIQQNGVAVKSNRFTVQFFNSTTYWITFINSTSLNENSLNIGFLPGSITDLFGNHLTVNEVEQPYEAQTGINEQIDKASVTVQQTTNIFGWIALAIILLFLIKSGYPVLITIECLQMYYMYIFILLEPMPYLQLKFLDALKYLHFLFIPVFFPEIEGYTNENYEIFLTNTSFLHNCSPFIFIFGFVLLLFMIISILAFKGCVKNKTIRHGAKKIKKYRLRYMIFNDAFWFTYLYTMFMALYQFRQASIATNWDIFNIVFASLVALLYLVYTIFIIYLGSKYKNPETKVPKKWAFIKMQPSSFPMEIPLRYLRKLFVCVALLIPSVDAQCIILIMANLIFLLYTACYMPAKSQLTNAINITIDSSYVLIVAMFYGYHRLKEKNLDQQTGFGIAFITIHALVLFAVLIWLIYRAIIMISQTQTWKKIYEKCTQNKDPEYLRQQQKKRDLQFSFGSLQQRSQQQKTDNYDSTSRGIKGHELQEKFNIFDMKKDDDDENESQIHHVSNEKYNPRLKESSINLGSSEEDQRNKFSPHKTQEIKSQKKGHLEIRQKERKDDLEEIVIGKKESSALSQLDKNQKKKSNAIWDDIEFDDNEI